MTPSRSPSTSSRAASVESSEDGDGGYCYDFEFWETECKSNNDNVFGQVQWPLRDEADVGKPNLTRAALVEALWEHDLVLYDVRWDENSRYRALADQLLADAGRHSGVRAAVMNILVDMINPFWRGWAFRKGERLDDDVDQVTDRGTWGYLATIRAAVVALQRPIVVVHGNRADMYDGARDGVDTAGITPLWVYFDPETDHYESIRHRDDDPYAPTAIPASVQPELEATLLRYTRRSPSPPPSVLAPEAGPSSGPRSGRIGGEDRKQVE